MPDVRRLEGRVAIVTGGGSGIGAATARRLSSEGASVVCADLNLAAAQAVASEVAGAAVEHDVVSRTSWEALLATVGGVDILINNAGVTRDRSLLKMSDDEWQTVIDIHLKGMWLGCQHVVPSMRERGGGAIVNLSSEARHGAFGQSNYSAAKAGIVGLTRTVALEHARHGIRCNAVAPGAVDTPMTREVPDEVRETWKRTIALRRFGEASEVAAAVAFLASPDAAYITGHVLDV